MYSWRPNLIIGFHSCDEKVRDDVLNGKASLVSFHRNYHWLGDGLYFWEYNLKRADEYAKEDSKRKNSFIKKPSVLGAIIQLGRCLDLSDSTNIDILKIHYEKLIKDPIEKFHFEELTNKPVEAGGEPVLKFRDCFIFNSIHKSMKELECGEFDTIRAPYLEGKPIYPGTEIREKNHIQICVRNINSIKGYFLPLLADPKHPIH